MIGNTFDSHVVAFLLEPVARYIKQSNSRLVVLALFDGLGATAVALQKLGLLNDTYLECYIPVEIDYACNKVVTSFFHTHQMRHKLVGNEHCKLRLAGYHNTDKAHKQKGHDITDSSHFYGSETGIRKWIEENNIQPKQLLVVAGSPCNNIQGTNNMRGRNEPNGQANLKGAKSKLFYVYTKILQRIKKVFPES